MFHIDIVKNDDPFEVLRQMILGIKDQLKVITFKERDFVTEMSKYLDCNYLMALEAYGT